MHACSPGQLSPTADVARAAHAATLVRFSSAAPDGDHLLEDAGDEDLVVHAASVVCGLVILGVVPVGGVGRLPQVREELHHTSGMTPESIEKFRIFRTVVWVSIRDNTSG